MLNSSGFMATAQHLQSFKDAATCCICLEYFTDPVSLDCRHSFCRSCITPCWERAGVDPCCPQCRCQGRNFRPNRELGAIVEFIKLHIPQEEGLCPRHLLRLQLFCAEDHTLLCVICRESQEHKPHTVCPMEEVAQRYRDTLHSHMEQLRAQLQQLERLKAKSCRAASQLEENFRTHRDRVCRTFEDLKDYLEQESRLLLSRLEQKHNEDLKKIREVLTHQEELLTTHRDLVAAIEVKCKEPDVNLLMDIQDLLSRCDQTKSRNPQKGGNNMNPNTQRLRQPDPFHEKIMAIKEEFPTTLLWRYVKAFECDMTLDPETAHRRLILSEDRRSVRLGDKDQDLPDTPKRFDIQCFVLGKPRLSSGRHYWEVEVGDATGWVLGVCDESVDRKVVITPTPANGYWRVCFTNGKYHTATRTPLASRVRPGMVGLFLDCEVGSLSVYDVQDRSLILDFPRVSFSHTLRPLFSPELSEGGKPAVALRILPVMGRE